MKPLCNFYEKFVNRLIINDTETNFDRQLLTHASKLRFKLRRAYSYARCTNLNTQVSAGTLRWAKTSVVQINPRGRLDSSSAVGPGGGFFPRGIQSVETNSRNSFFLFSRWERVPLRSSLFVGSVESLQGKFRARLSMGDGRKPPLLNGSAKKAWRRPLTRSMHFKRSFYPANLPPCTIRRIVDSFIRDWLMGIRPPRSRSRRNLLRTIICK